MYDSKGSTTRYFLTFQFIEPRKLVISINKTYSDRFYQRFFWLGAPRAPPLHPEKDMASDFRISIFDVR